MLSKRSYLFSRAIGGLANSLFAMTFIWWLQVTTTSSYIVGVSEALFSATAAMSVLYGPIIDRVSFKKTSIYSMIAQTILLFATTGAMYYLSKNYIIAIVLATLVSICDEFFNPSDRAILKETIVDSDELTNLISKVSVIDQFISVAGITLSGLLLTFLIPVNVMLICAFFSLLSIVILCSALRGIPSKNLNHKKKSNNNYLHQVLSGYKFLRKNTFLNHYFYSSMLYSLVTPALSILLPRVAQKAGNPNLYSIFYVCFMLGFIIGAFIAGKLKAKVSTVGIAWISSSFPLALMILFLKNYTVFSFLILLFGAITSIHNILSESLLQIFTGNNILGRVLTTIRTCTSIGGPIGSLVAGVLLDNSGEEILIVACSIVILIGGVNILIVEQVNNDSE